MKRTLSVILAIVLMLPTIFCVTASAASYPSISASKYIEFKAQQDIKVYKDKTCKTRGTSSPAKAYNASISEGDDCRIYELTASYIVVNYPVGTKERRTGYIRRSDLFDKTEVEEHIPSAKASVSVYKAYGKNSSIAKGDKVWRVDPKVGYEGYRAVIYPTPGSGKRAYKMGYITLDDLKKIRGEDGGSETKKGSLADIAEAEVGYQGTGKNGKGTGDYTKYGEFTKANGAYWCASFVSWCVKQAGVSTKIVPKTAGCDEMEEGSNSYHKWDKNALKSIKRSDVIFFADTTDLKDADHVGIVTAVNSAKKTITLVEGNTKTDMVKQRTYTVDSATGEIKTSGWEGRSFCGYISVGGAAMETKSQTSQKNTANNVLTSPVPAGCYFNKKTNDCGGDNWYGYHDINRGDVSQKTPVYAIADGTIRCIQRYATYNGKKYLVSYGNYIDFTADEGGYTARYAHLSRFYDGVEQIVNSKSTKQKSWSDCKKENREVTDKTIATKEVKKGEIIGYIGTTGNSTGVHLHFELRKRDTRMDPTTVFEGLTK